MCDMDRWATYHVLEDRPGPRGIMAGPGAAAAPCGLRPRHHAESQPAHMPSVWADPPRPAAHVPPNVTAGSRSSVDAIMGAANRHPSRPVSASSHPRAVARAPRATPRSRAAAPRAPVTGTA